MKPRLGNARRKKRRQFKRVVKRARKSSRYAKRLKGVAVRVVLKQTGGKVTVRTTPT